MPTVKQSDDASISNSGPGLLSDEFIPVVSLNHGPFDKEDSNGNKVYLIDGDKAIEDKEETITLSEYIDEDKRNAKKITLFTSKKELQITFSIEKGSIDSDDDDGIIRIVPSLGSEKVTIEKIESIKDEGVNLLNGDEFKASYDSFYNIDFSIQSQDEISFTIDFYAKDDKDDEWNVGELDNVHCGRIKISKVVLKSKIYFYSQDDGEFLGEKDSNYDNNNTILVKDSEWTEIDVVNFVLKKEVAAQSNFKIFDWNITNSNGFPSLGRLIHEYPTDINGNHRSDVTIDHDKYYNQCAIRLSYGLTNSKFDLSSYPSVNKTNDGFARSSKGLADWLWKTKQRPKIYKNTSEFDPKTSHGIIFLWDKAGISHIDIIYYGQTGSGYYGADEIWYWELE